VARGRCCLSKGLGTRSALNHIWVQLGHCEKESGKLTAAETAYRKSVDIDPFVADTHLQLGHALKLQGKLADAKASYERALELDPRSGAAKAEVAALSELAVESKPIDSLERFSSR
jgi:Tfp pilus assembly protein PilF